MINLDHHATTPPDPRVVAAMLPFFGALSGNASSSHGIGRRAGDAVAAAREQVAVLLGARASDIVWTSGATEANNLAILGLARAWKTKSARRKIVTSAIEHPAVLGPSRALQSEGFSLCILPVDNLGRVKWEYAESEIDETTLLVSIQAANSEVGTIQNIRGLADLAHEHGAFFHCDAAQAVGKVPVSVEAWNVDLLSLSAHKFGGPQGMGVLFRRGGRRLTLAPLNFGGGHEDSLRPGTLPIALIVGLGVAAQLVAEDLSNENMRVAYLRDDLEIRLKETICGLQINGDTHHRLPNNSSLTFPGVEAEAILANLPDVALSTGSACSSGALEPSSVLMAMGMPYENAFSTLRVGLGRSTNIEEIKTAAVKIGSAWRKVRTLTS